MSSLPSPLPYSDYALSLEFTISAPPLTVSKNETIILVPQMFPRYFYVLALRKFYTWVQIKYHLNFLAQPKQNLYGLIFHLIFCISFPIKIYGIFERGRAYLFKYAIMLSVPLFWVFCVPLKHYLKIIFSIVNIFNIVSF